MTSVLIVTDLDGSLLNHHDYSAAAALPVLRRLQRAGIAVVFNTSKTRRESRRLARSLSLHSPCIVENGSAIWFPADTVSSAPQGSIRDRLDGEAGFLLVLGQDHGALTTVIQPLRERFRFRALSEASIEEVVAETGLSRDAAELARQREFSEPLLWRDDENALVAFREQLHQQGCNLLKGGRFLHVIGDTDKGRAMRRLLQHFPDQQPPPTLMALGDSDNDIEMLRAADIAAIIRSPQHPPPDLGNRSSLIYSESCGAAGWAECVTRVLNKMNI